MLQYSSQYQISCGILFAFTKNSDKRLLSVKHTEKKIEGFKPRFPYTKYEQFTKENFIVLNLYINFTKSPSSLDDVTKYLIETDFNKEVVPFKNKILNYKEHLSKQVEYLLTEYGKPSIKDMFDSYRTKKIEFYTLWFYLYFMGYDLYKEFDPIFNRTQKFELQKIKNLLLYMTFSEKSLSYMKILFEQSDLLGDIE